MVLPLTSEVIANPSEITARTEVLHKGNQEIHDGIANPSEIIARTEVLQAELPLFRDPSPDSHIGLNFRNYSDWILLALGTLVAIMTILYVWPASISLNSLRALLWSDPQTTIFVVNLLGLFGMISFNILIATACDTRRWNLLQQFATMLDVRNA